MALPFAGVSFLVVGHICHDLTDGGKRIGGCATYAALTASRLGADTFVLTAAGPDLALPLSFSGIHIHCHHAPQTTTFRNIYIGNSRRQELHAWAGPIPPIVPPDWPRPDIVLLGPIAAEVSLSMARQFPGSFVGLSPQGWMRQWDSSGRVKPRPWRGLFGALGTVQVMVLSRDDVSGDEARLAAYAQQVPVLVATRGYEGADLYLRREGLGIEVLHCPAWPAREVDPTGAGDVFATAFLLHLSRCKDIGRAVEFASVVAGLSVEAPGLDGVPTYEQVERALERPWPGRCQDHHPWVTGESLAH